MKKIINNISETKAPLPKINRRCQVLKRISDLICEVATIVNGALSALMKRKNYGVNIGRVESDNLKREPVRGEFN
jgi:hypothetical protein